MIPVAALLGAAGIGAGGSLVNTGLNMLNEKWNRDFNAREAQKQRDFEERMSNTAYQRSVADMEAAGINPNILAGGQSASTPQGYAGSYSGHNIGGVDMSGVSSLINSAVSLKMKYDYDYRLKTLATARALADETFKQFYGSKNYDISSGFEYL